MSDIVLVTGGTGFVGRQVLRALCAAQKKIRLIVHRNDADLAEFLPYIESTIPTANLFVEDAAWWAKVCEGVDTIIHIAWFVEPGVYLQSAINLECLSGTLALAAGAAKANVRRLVGIGTCFEYEMTPEALSINTPLRPVSVYAAAKASAFLTLSNYCATQDMEFAWCRLFYLYGEGEDPRRLVPYLHQQLSQGKVAELTSGTQVRDFLDVAEAGRMIAYVATSKIRGAINICSGVPITVRQLAEAIADEYGRRDLLNFGARPDNVVDPISVVGERTVDMPSTQNSNTHKRNS